MFLKNSRYYGLSTVTAKNRAGEDVSAVKLRPLPATAGDPVTVKSHDQLDVLGETKYHDATRYWRIADANSELEAAALVRTTGRVIDVPKS